MSTDSEASPIPSPDNKTFSENLIRSPHDPYDMESSNGSSSAAAGRRSPADDEDSRSSEYQTIAASKSDDCRKVPGSSTTDASAKNGISSCNGDGMMDKSESECSSDIDIDIEEEDREEVRVKKEAKSPAKKTLAPAKPLRSFLIDDILNHKPKRSQATSRTAASTTTTTMSNNSRCPNSGAAIVRPWDLPSNNHRHKRSSAPYPLRASPPAHSRSLSGYDRSHTLYLRNRTSSSPKVNGIRPRSADDDSQSEASSDMSEEPTSGRPGGNGNSAKGDGNSPLDALFELTNKALDRVNGDKSGDAAADHMNLFNNRQPPKKKRKSRTAFTNHQIFELEKRFLYQKYLSPADRDELAGALGLTGAQVITWFQNRRAKLKRDVEELKKDMESAKMASIHKSLLLSESAALTL